MQIDCDFPIAIYAVMSMIYRLDSCENLSFALVILELFVFTIVIVCIRINIQMS